MMVDISFTFTWNRFYEGLLVLRCRNHKAFKAISLTSKLALAQYEQTWRETALREALSNEGGSNDVIS